MTLHCWLHHVCLTEVSIPYMLFSPMQLANCYTLDSILWCILATRSGGFSSPFLLTCLMPAEAPSSSKTLLLSIQCASSPSFPMDSFSASSYPSYKESSPEPFLNSNDSETCIFSQSETLCSTHRPRGFPHSFAHSAFPASEMGFPLKLGVPAQPSPLCLRPLLGELHRPLLSPSWPHPVRSPSLACLGACGGQHSS